MDMKIVISEKEYKILLLKFLEGKTLTENEYSKLTAYENSIKANSIESGQRSQARSLSTPEGRAWAEKEKHESGIISSILVVIGVIALGIVTAFLAFGNGK